MDKKVILWADDVELGEFKPCFVYNRELDILEWFAEDVGHAAYSVGPPHAADVFKAFDDGRIVGVQMWGALAAIKAALGYDPIEDTQGEDE